MSSAKLIFNTDEVQRLKTKIGQVSQDTNRLYLQLKGQASGWNGIPMGDHLMKAQVLINELTVEAEKLEDIIRTALKGVEGLQEENKQKADELTQRFSLFAGMFGGFRVQRIAGQTVIPTAAQKAASNLIRSFAALPGRDELDSDPAVKQLRIIIQTSGLGTVEVIAAQSKLKDIFAARDQIAKAQLAYKVYEAFDNKVQMNAVHLQAEEARQKLASLGVDEVHYDPGKDLSRYFEQPAVKACDYDPSITTGSVPLPDNESYAFLLRMSAVAGAKGEWAKQQLEQMKPQATIGPYDPRDFVSDQEILNLDDPEVQKRLSMTYWNTLSTAEKDRIIAEVQGDYKKLNKEVADKNRLLGSGVGNQTLANILVGGSNILVHAIDRMSLGMAGTVTNWIAGPAPEGYVNPMDNPYGKKAGIIAGEIGSWFVPFKFLEKVKTVGVLGKVSPTLWRSALSGTVSSIVGEVADAINDFREDGKQGLGERLSAVGINTVIAGVGDVAIRAGSKVVASAVRFVRGKLPDIKVGEVRGAGSAIDELEVKAKDVVEPRIEGMGNLYPTRTIDPIKEAHIISRVKELRSLLTSDYKKSGNFAFAEVDIVNIKEKEFFAHSSIDELSPSLSERVPNISIQPQNPVFKATDAPNKEGVWYPRDSDTEYKILNQIASELKGKTDTVGTIKLFTELDTCLSCNRVIAEFTSKYKNITVEVIHNNGNRIK